MNIFKRVVFAFKSYDTCRAADKMINDLYESLYCLKSECEALRKDAKMAIFKFLQGETVYCVINKNKVPSEADGYIIGENGFKYIKDYRVYKFTVKYYIADKENIYITVSELDYDKYGFKISMSNNHKLFKEIDFAINYMGMKGMINSDT